MDSWTVASSFLLLGLVSCAALSAFDTGKSKTFPYSLPRRRFAILSVSKVLRTGLTEETFTSHHKVGFEDRVFVALVCFRTRPMQPLQNFIQNSTSPSASLREDLGWKRKTRSVLVFSVVDGMLLLIFLMPTPCS